MSPNKKMPFGVKFLNILLTILFVLITVILFTSFYFTHTKNTPTLFGYNISIMNGAQMQDYIPDKSGIITSNKETLKPGNFALCKIGEDNPVSTILLVVDVENKNNQNIYYMRTSVGNDGEQIKVIENQIIGKTVYYSEFIGQVLGFMIKPIGIITLLILPALILILWVIYHFLKRGVKEKEWEHIYNSSDENVQSGFSNADDDMSDDIMSGIAPAKNNSFNSTAFTPVSTDKDITENSIPDDNVTNGMFIPPTSRFEDKNFQSAFTVVNDLPVQNKKNNEDNNLLFSSSKPGTASANMVNNKFTPVSNVNNAEVNKNYNDSSVKKSQFAPADSKTQQTSSLNEQRTPNQQMRNNQSSRTSSLGAEPSYASARTTNGGGAKTQRYGANVQTNAQSANSGYSYGASRRPSYGSSASSDFKKTSNGNYSNGNYSKSSYASSYSKKPGISKPNMESASESIDNFLKSVQGYTPQSETSEISEKNDISRNEIPRNDISHNESYSSSYNQNTQPSKGRLNSNQSLAQMLKMLDDNANKRK